jgi:hypothetical protein
MGILRDMAAAQTGAKAAATPAKNAHPKSSAPAPSPAGAVGAPAAGALGQEIAAAEESATSHPVRSTSATTAKSATDKTVFEPEVVGRPASAASQHSESDHPRTSFLLGPPQLLSGEDQNRYDKLEADLHAAVNPKDIFEKLWLRDLVDHEWEILRWRRLTVALVTATQQEALKQSLYPLLGAARYRLGEPDAEELARDFVMGKKASIKEVNEVLTTAGLTWDSILAEAMALKIGAIESFDCMCKTAEVRRDAQLRQIENHRKSFGPTLRGAIKQIEDAEFQVVPPDLKDAA